MPTNPDILVDLIKPLRAFIRRRVSDAHLAEDLAQEVLLRAAGHLDDAPEGERLVGWVFRIARNVVIDHYRSPRSRAQPGLEAVAEPAAAAAMDASMDDAAERDMAGCLKPMMAHLPPADREALEWTEFEGISQQALADRIGLTLPAAKSRVQRARRRLRELFVECCAVQMDRTGRVIDHHPTARSAELCGNQPGTCGDASREKI